MMNERMSNKQTREKKHIKLSELLVVNLLQFSLVGFSVPRWIWVAWQPFDEMIRNWICGFFARARNKVSLVHVFSSPFPVHSPVDTEENAYEKKCHKRSLKQNFNFSKSTFFLLLLFVADVNAIIWFILSLVFLDLHSFFRMPLIRDHKILSKWKHLDK